MKDPTDRRTADLAGDLPKKRGRPAKHASAAERQAAFRKRKQLEGHPIKHDSIAELKARIREFEAQSAEQIAEIARLQTNAPARKSTTTGIRPAAGTYEGRYRAVQQMAWVKSAMGDQVKRLRTNLRKASSAIAELKNLLPNEMSNPDAPLVDEMLTALSHYDTALEHAVHDADQAKTDQETKQKLAAEAAIFGDDISLETALAWIDAVISLDGTEGREWMKRLNGAYKAELDFVGDEKYGLNQARASGNAAVIRAAVAKAKLALYANGRATMMEKGAYWSGGWSDVVRWKERLR